jgi:hypothetical protein
VREAPPRPIPMNEAPAPLHFAGSRAAIIDAMSRGSTWTVGAIVLAALAMWAICWGTAPPDQGAQAIRPAARPEQNPEIATSRDTGLARIVPKPVPEEVVGDLLVAGRVVDDAQAPVEGARVRLERLLPKDPSAAFRGESWRDVDGVRWEPSDANGAFGIRGRVDATELRVSASKPGLWGDPPVRIAPGMKELVLQLHAGGALEGSAILPAWVEADEVMITAFVAVGGAWMGRRAHLAEGGRFRLEGLREGAYTVVLEDRDSIRFLLFAEVADVPVRVGETTRDPRLNFDVSGIQPPVVLTVVDRDGRPIGNATAAEADFPVKLARARACVRGNDGKLRILLHTPAADVVVGAPGCRTQRVRGVSASREVMLEKGVPIRIAAVGDAFELEEGMSLQAELWTGGSIELPAEAGSAACVGHLSYGTFDNRTRLATCDISQPGRFRLDVRIYHHPRGNVEVATKQIDVADSSVVQEFEITLTAEAVAKAIEQLKAQ